MTPDELKQLIAAIDRLALSSQKNYFDIGSLILGGMVGIATFAVLVKYTIETIRLRRAAQKQVEATDRALAQTQEQVEISTKLLESTREQVQISTNLLESTLNQSEVMTMPVLVCFVGPEWSLMLKNTGNGVALNILIETTEELMFVNVKSTPSQSVLMLGEDCKFRSVFSPNDRQNAPATTEPVIDAAGVFAMFLAYSLTVLPLKVTCTGLNGTCYTFVYNCFINDGSIVINYSHYTFTKGKMGLAMGFSVRGGLQT